MTPKHPLIESKRTLILKNRQILTTNREPRLASENNFFSRFSGRTCVQHYIPVALWANPPHRKCNDSNPKFT